MFVPTLAPTEGPARRPARRRVASAVPGAVLLAVALVACGDGAGDGTARGGEGATAPSSGAGGADAAGTAGVGSGAAGGERGPGPSGAGRPREGSATASGAAGGGPDPGPGGGEVLATEPGDGPWLVAAGPASGIVHTDLSGPPAREGKFYTRDCIGHGIAVLDADRDGRLDLYFPQGRDGTEDGGDCRNRLYLNDGDRTFTEAGAARDVDDESYSYGALAFDADADGDDDLLVTNLGPNRLLRHEAERFVDVTADHPGLAGEAHHWSVGAAAGDTDLDGDLDLYVANYVEQDLPALDEMGLCRHMSCKVPCGPHGLTPQPDRFYRNDDGRFVPANEEAGLAAVETSYGFQPTFADVDDDGDLDLYVTNDSVFNFLFENDGGGRFSETALVAGAACGRAGQMEAGMGLAVGHADDDAFPEIYVTNFSNQYNAYYRNVTEPGGIALFEESSQRAGCGRPTWFRLGWGTSFADFDADGLVDLFVANGHVYPQVDDCPPDLITYRQRNQLFVGTGGGDFADATLRSGSAFASVASHRGSIVADLDDDGRLDLVVTRLDEVPLLAWNETPSPGHALVLRVLWEPAPGAPPTLAVGARVTAVAGGRRWTRDVVAGSSFMGTEDPRVHLGLGGADVVERLTIRLPGGRTEELSDVAAGRHLRVVLAAGGGFVVEEES